LPELVLEMRNRCRGFATILDVAFEYQTAFNDDERRGFAQLVYDAIRGENIAGVGAKAVPDPIFPMLFERQRLEDEQLAAIKATDVTGSEEAKKAQDDACTAVCAFERELLMTRPTTRAGAIALLKFIADDLDSLRGGEAGAISEAIRNCVAALTAGGAA
jgi:hypothetical protein